MSQERTAAPSARVATTSVANPFASLDRERFRALASRIDANAVMISKLRDRLIDPATIPRGFCDYLAEEMDEPVDALIAHLYAPPEVSSARQLYKAEGKPALTARQSFEEAVAGSGLSEEQRRHLLSFR